MVPPQTAPNQVIQPTVANTVGTSTPAVVITPQMTTTALPGQAGVGPQTVATGATLAQPGLSAVAPQVAGTYTSGYGGYYGPGYGTGYYSAGYNTGYGTYPAQSAMQVPQGSTVIVQREPSYQRRHHHHHRRRPRSADTYYRDYAYDY
ncbi:hypothetical protein OBBRIDRAFT_527077 [Obba rivulosa]|uniref:Uncharacterized protein n=1 Tax=Obba rivulosa TaxID=1052685 RepID=A0A8E2DLU1_9APHY|nr:hypothetical protein OBBRIDRAFT_527077 [Obba rivulosa]